MVSFSRIAFAGIVALAFLERGEAASKSKLSIGEATKFCETEVPKHCVSVTCPLFCDSLRSSRLKTSCRGECNKNKRCLLKPAVGNDDPKNMILDAQNRDQLWACIAEKRDPDGTTTGRREGPWKALQTTGFKKATGRR